jgi:hypothetical protein
VIAVCHIRQQPQYRREAFEKGLRAAGYNLVASGSPAGAEDLLVIWNRYGPFHAMATAWERKGGTVLVCENGYVGKDDQGRQLYAISATGHNGSGWWPVSDEEDRFASLGLPVHAWRFGAGLAEPKDGYVLVCGQRGIGSPAMASPPDWHKKAAHEAAKNQLQGAQFKVKVRLHPGDNTPPPTTIEQDLVGAVCCVIWSSSSGVKALLAGVPVVYDAPHWICAVAAERYRDVIGAPDWGDRLQQPDLRLPALRRMAHAQWRVAEIEAGEPFRRFRVEIKRRREAA